MDLEEAKKLIGKRILLRNIVINDIKNRKSVERITDVGGILDSIGPRKNIVFNDPLVACISRCPFVLESLDQIELVSEPFKT